MQTKKMMIKKLLYRFSLYKIGLMRNRFYILPYHMVSECPNGFYPESAKSNFEKEIRHLSEKYRILSLSEIVERARKRQSIKGCVAITFDDGFRDNFTNVFPILKKYNAPATIFLITGCIDSGNAPWFIKFRHAFMTTNKKELNIELYDKNFCLPLITYDDKFQSSNILMNHLKNMKNGQRLNFLELIFQGIGVDTAPLDGMMLTWDQIKEMAGHGISFGAHTVTHPVMSKIGLEEAEEEIRGSKEKIETIIGMPVTSFAFPFGRKAQYSPELIEIFKRMDFHCVVTTEPGSNGYGTNPFELKRSGPWELMVL